jgi:hypothetical protein
MDGTCINIPAEAENEAAYGRPENGNVLGPFPQIRVSCLVNLRTHVIRGLSMGAFSEGELSLMTPLWDLVPDHSLTVVDRGLHSYFAFDRLTKTGTDRHWMTLAKKTTSYRVLEKFGPGDELVRARHIAPHPR